MKEIQLKDQIKKCQKINLLIHIDFKFNSRPQKISKNVLTESLKILQKISKKWLTGKFKCYLFTTLVLRVNIKSQKMKQNLSKTATVLPDSIVSFSLEQINK
ncbi:hypothetical protein BpHYR1_001475 [Brachionus plicatilis]|uniref:Uncharacterized protein n=1 Tax=Brachionus plicatilis TaxID=10195 RepID=A0A3M7PSA0_BRAPC|nr:hypothetical protein BpHYR1_001475 [Brachionus plicatilis]